MLFVLSALLMQAAPVVAATPSLAPAPIEPAASPNLGLDQKISVLSRPGPDDMARAAPEAAMRRGIDGATVLLCLVGADGRYSACRVESETPPGLGFAAGALKVVPKFKMALTASDGSSVVGRTVRVPIRFVAPR